jgi:hypothetical protein
VTFTPGQRVRTLIDLHSAPWDPEQPDIPAGSLGTIERSYSDPITGNTISYAVLLDASVARHAAAMRPDTIEADQ